MWGETKNLVTASCKNTSTEAKGDGDGCDIAEVNFVDRKASTDKKHQIVLAGSTIPGVGSTALPGVNNYDWVNIPNEEYTNGKNPT